MGINLFSDDDPHVENAVEMWADIKARLTTPDTRSRSTKLGPSGIGDPCDRCVGLTMALRLPGQPEHAGSAGGLKAFFGTGLHKLIEERLEETRTDMEYPEREYDIEEIPGYGMIRGTGDWYNEKRATLFDWKTSDRPKIRKYRLHGVPLQYQYQLQMYGLGIYKLGWPIKWVSNIFFPRDSNNWDDCWQYVEAFDPRKARQALRRAQTIWERYVLTGDVEELAADDDCWRCQRGGNVTIELGDGE